MRNSLLVAALFVAVGCGGPAPVDSGSPVGDGAVESELRPDGKDLIRGQVDRIADYQNVNDAAGVSQSAKARGTGINYHGGPVMTGTANIYYIWYGNWSGNTGDHDPDRLWRSNIGGSPYYNINTTYYNGANVAREQRGRTTRARTTDNYSQGTSLARPRRSRPSCPTRITGGRLPKDTNGVYFVLTSADVNATRGFCTQYCGWHTHATIARDGHQVRVRRQPRPLPVAPARRRPPAPTATPAPTAWRRSSRTSSRRRPPIPTSTPGTTDRGAGERRQVRLDVRHRLRPRPTARKYNITLGGRDYPHPAELGERRRRLLRDVVLVTPRA